MDADALYARAFSHHAMRQTEAALADCAAALALRPSYAEALHLRGVALADLHQYAAALASYAQALALRPDYAEAHHNRGLALSALGQAEAALASFATASAFAPDEAHIYVGRGSALEKLGRYAEALADFDRALALNPDYPWLRGTRLFTKMRLCDWRNFDADVADIVQRVARGEAVTPSLSVIAFTDSPATQRRAASIWTRAEHPQDRVIGPVPARAPSDKIRLGYFSMDFREHPSARGAAVVIEGHDRARFETYAFSFGPDTRDAMRARIANAADHFIDVRALSDAEIAERARSLGIDIAIDLAGHTTDARPGIFALRAAPLQVSYLSCPMLADYMDYVIIEERLIPRAQWPSYPEKFALVPHLIPTDHSRPAVDKAPPRSQLGLPTEGFVFCCFNSLYKITPQVFQSWMRILARVPDSVLWLANGTTPAITNLRIAAATHGIEPDRLIFAAYAPAAQHAARQRAAQLFLDTLPFTAQTTAIDALWAGLPVLTREGESLTGRGSASILAAAGLPELITRSQVDYEAAAVGLAQNPAGLASLRARLDALCMTGALFNRDSYIKPLEAVFSRMISRQRAGLPPDHITVSAS